MTPKSKPKVFKPASTTIRVTMEVIEHLRKHALPLVDDYDSVLRRLLGLPERKKDKDRE